MKNRNNETLLEKRAKRLLRYLDPYGTKRKLPRPYIIEVTGALDSGKTTIINILDVFFRNQRLEKGTEPKIWTPHEGARAIRNIPRTNYQANIAMCNHALQILLEHSHKAEYDVIIFDRCVYDAWCFIEWQFRKKELTQEEAENFKFYYAHEGWRKNIDICFFIMCDPKTTMKRNLKDSPTKKSGYRTNLNTATELYNAFKTGYSYFKKQGAPVVLIDTTNITPKQATKKVLIHALNAFERRFKKPKEERL